MLQLHDEIFLPNYFFRSLQLDISIWFSYLEIKKICINKYQHIIKQFQMAPKQKKHIVVRQNLTWIIFIIISVNNSSDAYRILHHQILSNSQAIFESQI